MTPESSLSSFLDRWPAVNECAPAVSWLRMRVDLGLAEGTVTVYARSLDDYLAACGGAGINPLQANQGDVARWIHQLDGLSNATLQLRLVAVRLFYDYLVEEGIRSRNPVGRGRRRGTDQGPPQRGLLPKLHKREADPRLVAVFSENPGPAFVDLLQTVGIDAAWKVKDGWRLTIPDC